MRIETIQSPVKPEINKVSGNDKTSSENMGNYNGGFNGNYRDAIKVIDTSGQLSRDVNEDELQKSIDKILKTLVGDSTSLKFDVHKETNTIMVKVIDNDTKEVIREIPPEKMLDMVASIWKLVGIIVDKKA